MEAVQGAPPVNRLRELRRQSKLTLAEVAKLMDTDMGTISRHESGERNLTPELVRRYARLYKCESYQLFFELKPE